jgi:hypothetical protein
MGPYSSFKFYGYFDGVVAVVQTFNITTLDFIPSWAFWNLQQKAVSYFHGSLIFLSFIQVF